MNIFCYFATCVNSLPEVMDLRDMALSRTPERNSTFTSHMLWKIFPLPGLSSFMGARTGLMPICSRHS